MRCGGFAGTLAFWLGVAMKKYKCPVCEKHEFGEDDFDVCPYCMWENDGFQNHNPDYAGGANKMSLNEARKAYKEGKKVL